MCTTIRQAVAVRGNAKGTTAWSAVVRCLVSYDHPVAAAVEHAVLVDGFDEHANRVTALELDLDTAVALADALRDVAARAEAHDGPDRTRPAANR